MPERQRSQYWYPTGRVRFRTTWFGLLVVEQEEDRHVVVQGTSDLRPDFYIEHRWRRKARGTYLKAPPTD